MHNGVFPFWGASSPGVCDLRTARFWYVKEYFGRRRNALGISDPLPNNLLKHTQFIRIDRHAADSGTSKGCKSTQLYLLDRPKIAVGKPMDCYSNCNAPESLSSVVIISHLPLVCTSLNILFSLAWKNSGFAPVDLILPRLH